MRIPVLLLLLGAFVVAGCASTVTPVASPAEQPPAALGPYAGLAAEIRTAVEDGFYEPAALERPNWQRFFASLDSGLAAATTDAEARAAFRSAVPEAGVSHLSLSKADAASATPRDGRPPASFTVDPETGIAVLDIRTFAMSAVAEPIVGAFRAMAADPPSALVVDIRGNGGGDLSSMLVVGHLIDAPAPAGLFVSRQFWTANDAVPPPSEWSKLPLLTSLDEGAFFQALSTHGAVVGVVPPMAPRYGGPVYLLTDGGTGSASEPLAYVLKATGRATLVGQPTAGQMLSGNVTALSDGWMLQVPVADYFVPDGTRIDGVGVTPDVPVPSADALQTALRLAAER